MKTWKKTTVVGIAALALLGMSGCSTLNEEGANSAITTYAVSFPDSSTVDCLYSVGSGHSGVKCMWGTNAATTTEKNKGLVGSIQKAGGVSVRCVVDGYGVMDCDTSE
jgi:hypothetical protein